jgi:hypothetical protein
MYRDWDVVPVQVTIPVPQDWTDAVLRYVITMPGWVLQTGELASPGKAFLITYDPETLQETFPNIDLCQPQSWAPGLSDEVFISFAISGNDGGNPVHRANVLTLHGEKLLYEGYEQPHIAPTPTPLPHPAKLHQGDAGGDIKAVYLPLILARWDQSQSARPPWCREESDSNCAPPAPEETLVEYVDLNDPSQDVGRER